MLIRLRSQATTTPKVRAEIQASAEPAWMLAERYGVTPQTIWKWKKRKDEGTADRSHTAHPLQTTLTPAQEAVVVALRKTTLLPLDDMLAVTREFLNPAISRSGLDRRLRRHGLGNLRDLKASPPKPKQSAFKSYEPGYRRVDVKYLPQTPDEETRRSLFVAIDRATPWVFVRIYKAKTAANARRFLRDLDRACPIRIKTILTDNGKEFTDRLFGLRARKAAGDHEFDQLCAALDIEHRLTKPRRPQTNGMVERFNGRIEDILQSHRFKSGEELETTILRYVSLYNGELPQTALKSKTPIQAMRAWHAEKPELFKKRPYYRPGCDMAAGAPIAVDTIAAFGREIGFTGRYRVNYPSGETGVWTLSSDSMSNDSADPTSDRTVHIDQYTGRILADVGFAHYGVAAKSMAVGIAFHEGDLGLWNIVLNTVFCLGVMFLCASGVAIWWMRRPARASRLVAPPMPANLPMWRGAVLICLALSLAFPLVGLTLVAVLALDALLLANAPFLKRALS